MKFGVIQEVVVEASAHHLAKPRVIVTVSKCDLLPQLHPQLKMPLIADSDLQLVLDPHVSFPKQ